MALLSEIGHWALIAFLMFVFIATAGHLMGLIVLSRAWKIGGTVLAAVLVIMTAASFWL